MDLSGRCVLVTGGAHRVGKAIALKLARMGAAQVVFTYNSSEEAADKTAQEIRSLGCEVLAIRCDQSDIQQIDAAIELVRQKFGRLDVLVNSASVLFEAEFDDVTAETWNQVLNINARGPFFFMQKAARLMMAGDGGVVINIIDESVLKPALIWVHHGASKAALWNITRTGAAALAPKIRVNAVLPGAVLKPPDYSDERWNGLIPGIPLQKLGSAEDVCQAIEYLIHADFVTGQMIVVDGGATVL
ncbi:MAG: SDR family oxidoreductase [Anaerolineaceae bacterium]|jgi:NAD(P)-dependent dehydrogenase (short-subunit alcohol dehydrogenase family)|nr:SDR family oxidoreductase [Anaerolineaceae bacterium]